MPDSESLTFLSNSLDLGEASVIQLALDRSIKVVCIDEAIPRRYKPIKMAFTLGLKSRVKTNPSKITA